MVNFLVKYLSRIYFPLILALSVQFGKSELELSIRKGLELTLASTSFIITLFYFFELPRLLKVLAIGIFSYFVYLSLLSYWEHGSFFYYPHVFNKLLLPLSVCCAFVMQRFNPGLTVGTIIKCIYGALAIKVVVMLVTGVQNGFQWGSDYRFLDSTEAGMLLIPMIHHFLLFSAKKEGIFQTLLALFFIFVAQHRTVWIAAVIAILLILLRFPLMIGKVSLTLIVGGYLGLLLLRSILPENEFQLEVASQLEDIVNFQSQGTGEWRMQQNEFFLAKIYEKPVWGWQFEAFELGDIMEKSSWDEKGTHIHSAYIDHTYYFGIVGLVMLYLGFLFLLLKTFKTNGNALLYCVFAGCMFSFGTSYQLPAHAYFFCGCGLYYLFQEMKEKDEIPEEILNPPVHPNGMFYG